MTPLPKKKHTRSRSNQRKNAASNRYNLPNLVRCPACKKLRWPHRACPACGFYKDSQ